MLQFIHWNVDPTLIELGPITFRWYGVLFALGIVLGFQLAKKMFFKDGLNEKQVDNILYVTVAGTIVGARLGHVFFYDWDYYSLNLQEIPLIWKGGLASHGGGIGIIIAITLYAKYGLKKNAIWVFDRMTIAVATGGVFIRLGNLMNHEIIGDTTDLPWAFIFSLVDDLPRHPAQLYEALSLLLILIATHYFYWKTNKKDRLGFISGFGLMTCFSFRFLIEFVKNSQGGFESAIDSNISTGQWLSVPFIITGIILIFYRKKSISKKNTITS
jgi:phosphatidylglycerol:prolipoprotein diacylglycerol transferase